jgi:predicted permease
LINEEMVRRYWSGRDPIGGRFKIGGDPKRPWVTVVGVVADVRHNGITGVIKEKFYIPHTQWDKSVGNPIRSMSLVVKTDGDPLQVIGPIRQEIRALDPALPIAEVRTMEEIVGATLSTPRFTGALLGLFAVLALSLSAVGIYGVLSYIVSRRTREIGIRLAIGARPGQVLAMVLRNGLALSFSGIALGVAAAAAATRLMMSLLHGVTPWDPATFAAVTAMLSSVALLASLVPAWRATRVDPVTALKTE